MSTADAAHNRRARLPTYRPPVPADAIDPLRAVREMARVLRSGGVLVVTVPNRLWRVSATVAALLKLRPYEGLENWVGWGELRREQLDHAECDQIRGAAYEE